MLTHVGRHSDSAEEPSREALLEQLGTYEALLAHVQEVIFKTDADGAWTFLNPAWTALTGFGIEESLGQPFLDYVHPDDRARNQELFRPFIAREKEVCRHEVRYLTRDGGYRWVEVHARLVLDGERTVGTTGTLSDISERRHALDQLMESEERWQRLVHNHPDPIILSVGGEILFCNPAGARVLGAASVDDLAGRSIFDFTPKPLRAKVEQRLQTLEQGGTTAPLEFPITRLDGTTRYIESFSAPVTYRGLPAAQTVIRDITDRKAGERARHERDAILAATVAVAEGLLRAQGWEAGMPEVLQHLGQALSVSRVYLFENVHATDPLRVRQRFEWVGEGIAPQINNPALQDFTYEEGGFGRWVETLGRGEPIATHLDDLPPHEAAFLEAQDIKAVLVVPVFVGNRWWGFIGFDDCVSLRRWSQAEVDALRVAAGLLGAAIQRHEAEAKLARNNDALQHRNEELLDFAYATSHDLQAPLRKIITFGNLLHEECHDALTPDGAFYIDRMRASAQHMSGFINALLNYSRLSTQRQPVRRVDLAETVKNVLSDLEVSIEETDADIEVGPLPSVEADPIQMHQLFLNLIGNAVKFHKRGVPPRVRIEQIDGSGTDGGGCRVMVRDEGIGFDQKYAVRIFSPFQRLHGKSSPYHGTGIGLAICRRIVERHGGTLTAQSAPGQGSTFVLELPAQAVSG